MTLILHLKITYLRLNLRFLIVTLVEWCNNHILAVFCYHPPLSSINHQCNGENLSKGHLKKPINGLKSDINSFFLHSFNDNAF